MSTAERIYDDQRDRWRGPRMAAVSPRLDRPDDPRLHRLVADRACDPRLHCSGARAWVALAATAGSARWSAWKRKWAACAIGGALWLAASALGLRPSSGNHAFDEYRSETLRRLEDEQREFRDFLERLRFAKDKPSSTSSWPIGAAARRLKLLSRRADSPAALRFPGRSPKGGRPDCFLVSKSAVELLDVFQIFDFLNLLE